MALKKQMKKIKRSIFGYLKLKKRKLFHCNTRPFLQVHLAEHCNLNCKSCAHFSPIAKESLISPDDLDKMFSALPADLENWFSRLELMGGEPLLHPLLPQILILTRRHFPGAEIRLVTNGLLLDRMDESFYRVCAENRILVYLSVYPITLDHEKIYLKLERYGVSHGEYGDRESSRFFLNYRLDPGGTRDEKRNYRNCRMGGRCLQLKDGRIYPCFLSAYAGHLNDRFHTDFQWESRDYLSLDNPLDQDQFHRFINYCVPFCRYCAMDRLSKVQWGLSEKAPEEWLISKGDST